MKIIGFDQSTKALGFSVFDNGKLTSYGIGYFDQYKEFDKLIQIRLQVVEILDKYKPDKVFLENTQYQRNPVAFRTLSKLLGILESTFYDMGIPYEVVDVNKWRNRVGINTYHKKREQLKQEAIEMVKSKFYDVENEDVCEGILIGLYGVYVSA